MNLCVGRSEVLPLHSFLNLKVLVVLGFMALFPTKVLSFTPRRAAIFIRNHGNIQHGINQNTNQKPLFSSPNEDTQSAVEAKEDRLLSLLKYIDNIHAGQNLPPCGLEATDKERALVQTVITEVEEDSENNLVVIQKGKVKAEDLFGDWNLLYTSSQTMSINKSLSGLGRSTSDKAKVKNIVQKLGGDKFIGNVELVEHFQGATEDASFDVKVTGEWFLLPDTNPNTNRPNTAIDLQLDKIDYVATKANADEWASLGPIKRLDIIYLSKTMLISRGSANLNSLFVWKRL